MRGAIGDTPGDYVEPLWLMLQQQIVRNTDAPFSTLNCSWPCCYVPNRRAGPPVRSHRRTRTCLRKRALA
jgi:hypothetical protein